MTFHSTITKAQPFPFSPLAISLGQTDSAVVTIRKALDELPVEIVESTLEELAAPTFDEAMATFLEAMSIASKFSAEKMHDLEFEDPARPAIEEEFGRVCDAQYAALKEMLLTPADSIQDIVDKVKYFNECDATGELGALEYSRQIESDLKRVTEIPYSRFMRGPLLEWQRTFAAIEEATEAAEAFDRGDLARAEHRCDEIDSKYPGWKKRHPRSAAHQAEIDQVGYGAAFDRSIDLWGDRTEALIKLWLLPAPSPAELAVKLKLFQQEEGWELVRAGEIVDRFVSDARRYGRFGAFLQTDADLLRSFAGLRREMADYLSEGSRSQEEDDASDERVRALEDIVWSTRATTVEGVVAKLRIAFQHMAGESWSDHSIVDPKHPDFVDGFCGGTNKLLWQAIEDLARIGGVNLSTQGAEPIAVH